MSVSKLCKAWTGKLEKMGDATVCKFSLTAGHGVSANVLAAIELTLVVTGQAVLGSKSI